jgi:hypothetical protein
MASQEPPVQFDENPKYEKIPEEETILNFNFDSNEQGSPEDEKDEKAITTIIQKNIVEALKSAGDAVKDEDKEVKEESTQQVQNKQAELSEAVSSQKKLEEEIVEVLAEQKSPAQSPAPPQIKPRRISNPSLRFAAYQQQQEQEARVIEEAKKQAQKRLKAKESKESEKTELLNTINLENVTDSQLSLMSDIDETDKNTIANRFITVGRLETYKPSSQAGVIFGGQFMRSINGETLCALCGFKLKDRISYWHNVFHKKEENTLTWSFDHRLPINFSAIIFSILFTNFSISFE